MRVVEEVCGIDDNMEVSHRRVAAPVEIMRQRAYVSRRHARGEGVGGASLVEANGDGDKSVWQDGNGGRLGAALTTLATKGFKGEISNNKIWEVIIGTNLVIVIRSCLFQSH